MTKNIIKTEQGSNPHLNVERHRSHLIELCEIRCQFSVLFSFYSRWYCAIPARTPRLIIQFRAREFTHPCH